MKEGKAQWTSLSEEKTKLLMYKLLCAPKSDVVDSQSVDGAGLLYAENWSGLGFLASSIDDIDIDNAPWHVDKISDGLGCSV